MTRFLCVAADLRYLLMNSPSWIVALLYASASFIVLVYLLSFPRRGFKLLDLVTLVLLPAADISVSTEKCPTAGVGRPVSTLRNVLL